MGKRTANTFHSNEITYNRAQIREILAEDAPAVSKPVPRMKIEPKALPSLRDRWRPQ